MLKCVIDMFECKILMLVFKLKLQEYYGLFMSIQNIFEV
jgi:hypothetical protein